jgi:hypothetical protein
VAIELPLGAGVWVLLSLVVAGLAHERGRGPWKALAVALLLSPIVGYAVVVALPLGERVLRRRLEIEAAVRVQEAGAGARPDVRIEREPRIEPRVSSDG